MKVISYSLFNLDSMPKFEAMAMLRGFYWNCRMNRLVYPDWEVQLNIDEKSHSKYSKFLFGTECTHIAIRCCTPKLCEGMIWRLLPIWDKDVTHVLCRDTDALTTYREAQAVSQWIKSDKPIHAILDNPAHAGLMGGMIGLSAEYMRSRWASFEDFIGDYDLSKRGSDQSLLNKQLVGVPTMWHKGKCDVYEPLVNTNLEGVHPKLWESNLTCRHIGSAGVIEMETIRFFNRFDKNEKFDEFEKQFPEIFYWHA